MQGDLTTQHTLTVQTPPPVAGVSHSSLLEEDMAGMVWHGWCDRTSITNSDTEDGKDAQV